MNRPRKHDKHLPRNVYHRHGAYYHVKAGKWVRIGGTLREALAAYATIYAAPAGSMPALISDALRAMLPRVRGNTARQYQTAARRLSSILVEFSPAEVKPKDVAAIKASMAATPNMANRCLSVLRQVFDFALEHQLVDSNPCVGIRRHLEQKRTRLITAVEYAAIHEHATERLQVIMDLLRLTGQRVTDVLAIRRGDVTDAGIRFQQRKTGARLTVAWTPELRAAVDRARGLNRNVVALTLLHNRRGKAPDYRTIRDQWARACRAAGVEDAHLHDLRAVALTAAEAQGKNPTALAGHTSPAQTKRYLRNRSEPVVESPSFGRPIDSAKKSYAEQ